MDAKEQTKTVTTGDKGFVAYEYLTLQVPRSLEPVYKDSFHNFGWTFEDYSPNLGKVGSTNLKFKRNRRIKNRPVVMELQRKCQTALETIDRLERSRGVSAFVTAMTIGLVGCGLLAGSVFAATDESWVVCFVLGIPGLLLWLLGYLSYNMVYSRKSAKVAPLVDREYEIVYETTEQANSILNG
jgi:hypothetical protein